MVGLSDLDRHYHPLGVAITSGETTKDYEFLFRSLKVIVVRSHRLRRPTRPPARPARRTTPTALTR